MPGFSSPNHTQTPNDLFDRLMREMSEAELKVVLAAVRKTLGYHRDSDEISLTQFEEITGMSRKGVVAGLQAAIERGVVREIGRGKRGVVRYTLVVESDQLPEVTSYQNTPELVTELHQSQARTSYQKKHTKERNQIKDKEKVSPSNSKLTKAQLAKQRLTGMDESQRALYNVFTGQFGYQPEYDDDFETDIARLSEHGITASQLGAFIHKTSSDEWWIKNRGNAAVRVKYAADHIAEMAQAPAPKPAAASKNIGMQSFARIYGLVGEVNE